MCRFYKQNRQYKYNYWNNIDASSNHKPKFKILSDLEIFYVLRERNNILYLVVFLMSKKLNNDYIYILYIYT